MSLTIGFVTDLHFGPAAYHDGKLRKLTRHAADLTRESSAPARRGTDLLHRLDDGRGARCDPCFDSTGPSRADPNKGCDGLELAGSWSI